MGRARKREESVVIAAIGLGLIGTVLVVVVVI